MNKMTSQELHPDKSNNKWNYFDYCMLKECAEENVGAS
jgi:hypothetical protein